MPWGGGGVVMWLVVTARDNGNGFCSSSIIDRPLKLTNAQDILQSRCIPQSETSHRTRASETDEQEVS